MSAAKIIPVDIDPAAPHLTEVRSLLARAADTDGFSALNEAAELELQEQHSPATHLVARDGDRVVGYAQLGTAGSPRTGFLVVDPAARRHGTGVRLAAALIESAPSPVQLLAPTDSAAAQALAARLGLVAARTLLVMRRELDDALPAPAVPAGVRIRPFRPGQDEAGWLAVNAAAFAEHPEQGAVTADDLAARMAEPWFDASGFFVAERDGAMIGFHWTKEHGGGLGEVYVLGVAPAGHRTGIGAALLLTGLRHLLDRGLHSVQLYVEAASGPAVALYASYGFTVVGRDVMYASRSTRAPQES